MISSLRRYIYNNWQKFPSLKKSPENVEFLLVAGSIEGGTTTFLLFEDNMKFPFSVVRAVRHLSFKEDLEREWDVLLMLKNTSFNTSVPYPIFYEVFAGIPTLCEGAIEGFPMQVQSASDGMPIIPLARSHFQKALDWIVALHQETENTLGKEVYQGDILKTIERCAEIFSFSPKEYKLLSDIIGADDLFPYLQRSFIVHGDFVPHNILLSKDSLRVIDWIWAKRSPFGCFDMFSFSIVYAMHARKVGGLQGYINAFSGAFLNSNNFSSIIKKCLHEYSNIMGIEASHIRALFALFLLMKAKEEYERHLSLVPYGFIPRWGNNTKLTYQKALGESVWIYFIKHLLREKDSFIIKDSHE